MAKDTLKITLRPPLLKALGLEAGKEREVDYYELLGVARGQVDSADVEDRLKQRTRVLRQWQNSPEFGKDVVKLLPVLHRVAKILSDPRRREAYRKELEMHEKGQTVGSTERFRELARVALVGNEISAADREQLQQFAREHGMDTARVRQIIEEVRTEYKAGRKAEPEGDWEFKIAGEGSDAFQTMLAGLKASGNHLGLGSQKLIEDGMGYGLDLQQAQTIVKQHQADWFKDMARMVAGDGAISEAQMRLLLPKAADFGLNEREAYAIISDYSLSAVASDELRRQFELAEETFTIDDIEDIIQDTAKSTYKRSFMQRLLSDLPLTKGMFAGILVLVLAMVIGSVGMWSYNNYVRSIGTPSASAHPGSNGPETGRAPDGGDGTGDDVAAPSPTPTPTATPTPQATLPPILPDPENGMLLLPPEKEGDPPAFSMLIREVTCSEYAAYLKSVMETPPPGWPPGGGAPPGMAEMPVTNVSWNEIQGFCLWIAERNNWPNGSVRLPTAAEFERATRGMTIRGHGNPQASDYWSVARLGQAGRAKPVATTTWDRISLAGIGQTYDLIGNVAEWGQDEKSGKHVVLGGSYNDKDNNFNAMNERWWAPDDRQPWLGFRYVHPSGQ
jgi:hypothetical protein